MGLFKKYSCDKCDAKFKQQEELMQHEQLKHGNKFYDCKVCNKNFSSMEEMRTHLQRYHNYSGSRD